MKKMLFNKIEELTKDFPKVLVLDRDDYKERKLTYMDNLEFDKEREEQAINLLVQEYNR